MPPPAPFPPPHPNPHLPSPVLPVLRTSAVVQEWGIDGPAWICWFLRDEGQMAPHEFSLLVCSAPHLPSPTSIAYLSSGAGMRDRWSHVNLVCWFVISPLPTPTYWSCVPLQWCGHEGQMVPHEFSLLLCFRKLGVDVITCTLQQWTQRGISKWLVDVCCDFGDGEDSWTFLFLLANYFVIKWTCL